MPKVGVANTNVDHGRVAHVIADLGTRYGEVYAPVDEVLLSVAIAAGDATDLGHDQDREPEDAFARSREQFGVILDWLGGERSACVEHADLESRLACDGRELLRVLLQDHLDLRAVREQRVAQVTDRAGVARGAVEADHSRPLGSVFGEVTVTRLAYRRRGEENLYVSDGALNLPVEQASHGVRRLAAVESARGSFDDALGQIRERTGLRIGKRQVEQLASLAAVDFDGFYATRERLPVAEDDVLVLSADGKGIVMRPDALRAGTAQAAARASPKLKTRLSRGEKRNRKRIAEVGAVYEIAPATRTATDVLSHTEETTTPPPRAKSKWLTASVVDDAASVIGDIFAEAERRDPEHQHTWVALVDGNRHQIDQITKHAKDRNVNVTIVIDLIHVLEYLWSAAWCFHTEGDPDAETWVHQKATAILEGRSGLVAAAIRRKATRRRLTPEQRNNADRAATYLTNKRRYLDYPTALSNGWPIATGIIEGACRHLVKDRLDLTGARWGLHGAEAILKLRAIRSNNDIDEYWTYHLNQERHRNHQSRYANSAIPQAT